MLHFHDIMNKGIIIAPMMKWHMKYDLMCNNTYLQQKLMSSFEMYYLSSQVEHADLS